MFVLVYIFVISCLLFLSFVCLFTCFVRQCCGCVLTLFGGVFFIFAVWGMFRKWMCVDGCKFFHSFLFAVLGVVFLYSFCYVMHMFVCLAVGVEAKCGNLWFLSSLGS